MKRSDSYYFLVKAYDKDWSLILLYSFGHCPLSILLHSSEVIGVATLVIFRFTTWFDTLLFVVGPEIDGRGWLYLCTELCDIRWAGECFPFSKGWTDSQFPCATCLKHSQDDLRIWVLNLMMEESAVFEATLEYNNTLSNFLWDLNLKVDYWTKIFIYN